MPVKYILFISILVNLIGYEAIGETCGFVHCDALSSRSSDYSLSPMKEVIVRGQLIVSGVVAQDSQSSRSGSGASFVSVEEVLKGEDLLKPVVEVRIPKAARGGTGKRIFVLGQTKQGNSSHPYRLLRMKNDKFAIFPIEKIDWINGEIARFEKGYSYDSGIDPFHKIVSLHLDLIVEEERLGASTQFDLESSDGSAMNTQIQESLVSLFELGDQVVPALVSYSNDQRTLRSRNVYIKGCNDRASSGIGGEPVRVVGDFADFMLSLIIGERSPRERETVKGGNGHVKKYWESYISDNPST